MVNINDKLEKIRELVDSGYYFAINRARQYGKTTTLKLLANYLEKDYLVIFLDFQMLSNAQFEDEMTFSRSFAEQFLMIIYTNAHKKEVLDNKVLQDLETAKEDGRLRNLGDLFLFLNKLCLSAKKPIVLMIDEVDSASNNQVFLDFLAMLRGYYLAREERPTFQSVILAGVYDIKNLKLKIRQDAEHKYNSPWNIAEPFLVDMSFSAKAISGMLLDYENDHHTGMDTNNVAECIYEYTSGYPFLVSSICKTIDTAIQHKTVFSSAKGAWSREGVAWAVKIILKEQATLFESLTRQIAEHEELKNMLKAILFQGSKLTYNPDNSAIAIGRMLGYITDRDGSVAVSNRIFEMRLYNLFLSEEELTSIIYQEAQMDKNQFLEGTTLNMKLILEKFVAHFNSIYGNTDERFVEKQGRKLFLLYLKPIINGTGNYYIESETRDMERTDVIVDYLGTQYVIELKIWHGNKYNQHGEAQIAEYLEKYQLDTGYMLTFSFNKKKKIGVTTVRYKDKTIIEALV